MKLTLIHPIQLNKSQLTELNFRDYATAGDLLAFDEAGPNRQTIALIANLTGTDAALIEKLHVQDYRAADALATRLISPELEGENKSTSPDGGGDGGQSTASGHSDVEADATQ